MSAANRYRVTLEYDQDAGCPCHEWDTLFQVVTGGNRRTHSLGRGRLSITADEFDTYTREAAKDLNAGKPERVIVLDVYEHSGIVFSLAGHGPADYGGWDTSRGGAVLIVKDQFREEFDGLSDEQRVELAEGFLSEFNNWANGEVYGYAVERLELCDHGEWHGVGGLDAFDGCYGFYGDPEASGLLNNLAEVIPGEATAEQLVITGAADYLLSAEQIIEERARIEAAIKQRRKDAGRDDAK